MKFLGEISDNRPKKLPNLVDNHCWQNYNCTNTTPVISKWGTYSPFSSLIILLLALPSNSIVSSIKISR